MATELKEYTNEEITITWKADKCIHSGKCVRGLPGVFNPRERPWIKIKNADTPHLIETVDKCPSGALSWRKVRNEDFEKQVDEAVGEGAKLHLLQDGPVLVKGRFDLVDASGNVIDTKNHIALCRCGASANKPFCDGSHKKAGFKG